MGKTKLGKWQKCPVCEGKGTIVVFPYSFCGTNALCKTCSVCNGVKVLERPAIKKD